MLALRVAICDDNIQDRQHLSECIEQCPYLVELHTFEHGEIFLESFYPGAFDLIFMDIYLQNCTGIEIIQKLREIDDTVPVVFTTNSQDFTLEAYRLRAFRYLEKPLKAAFVQDTLEFALLKKHSLNKKIVYASGKAITVPIRQVLYIEQRGHYVTFWLRHDNSFQIRAKLTDIMPQLPADLFLHCHKSYIVNLSFVVSYDATLMTFSLQEGKTVHIRRKDLRTAKQAWEQYLFRFTRND